ERIPVRLNGRRRRVNFVVGDKEEIWTDKAVNSVTANYVHSADATHLKFVALAAEKEGIEILPVHDCFGCLVPSAKHLNDILLERLHHLHKHNNLLGEVLAQARRNLPRHVELPSLPEIGNFDIDDVLKSKNAFNPRMHSISEKQE